jgi:hypothetical protein
VSLLNAASDPYKELAHIGDLQLRKVGRIVRVRLMPDLEHGPGVDVREFILPSFWDLVNNARARAATSGRRLTATRSSSKSGR